MGDRNKSKKELIAELQSAKKQIAGYEETDRRRAAALQFLLNSLNELEYYRRHLRAGNWVWVILPDYLVLGYTWPASEDGGRWSTSSFIHPKDHSRVVNELKSFVTRPTSPIDIKFQTRDEDSLCFRCTEVVRIRGSDIVIGRFFTLTEPVCLGDNHRSDADLLRYICERESDELTALMAVIQRFIDRLALKDSREIINIIDLKLDGLLREIPRTAGFANQAIFLFERVMDLIRDSMKERYGAFFIRRADSAYLYVSPAMSSLLGFPEYEIIGKTDSELFGPQAEGRLELIGSTTYVYQTIKIQNGATSCELMLVMISVSIAGRKLGYFGTAYDLNEIEITTDSSEDEIQWASKVMQDTMEQARKAARTEAIILLTGETGAGKDYLARYIHDKSKGSDNPFFKINCGALPPDLVESELFGHEKGAFTGASALKQGMLELAEGGTLLLNEIGELSPASQAKLLSFLDYKSFTRVGGGKSIRINARIIAATNRDLEREVEAGRFRADLLYRLTAIQISVPPLRDRPEDIPILVGKLLETLKSEMPHLNILYPPNIRQMMLYKWPGNVRELKNVLVRSIVLEEPVHVGPSDLTEKNERESPSLNEVPDRGSGSASIWSVEFPPDKELNELAKEMKRALIDEALRRSGGSRKKAAQMLGITRHYLKRQMKTCGYFEPE